jgi:hypothetical protein
MGMQHSARLGGLALTLAGLGTLPAPQR